MNDVKHTKSDTNQPPGDAPNADNDESRDHLPRAQLRDQLAYFAGVPWPVSSVVRPCTLRPLAFRWATACGVFCNLSARRFRLVVAAARTSTGANEQTKQEDAPAPQPAFSCLSSQQGECREKNRPRGIGSNKPLSSDDTLRLPLRVTQMEVGRLFKLLNECCAKFWEKPVFERPFLKPASSMS